MFYGRCGLLLWNLQRQPDQLLQTRNKRELFVRLVLNFFTDSFLWLLNLCLVADVKETFNDGPRFNNFSQNETSTLTSYLEKTYLGSSFSRVPLP